MGRRGRAPLELPVPGASRARRGRRKAAAPVGRWRAGRAYPRRGRSLNGADRPAASVLVGPQVYVAVQVSPHQLHPPYVARLERIDPGDVPGEIVERSRRDAASAIAEACAGLSATSDLTRYSQWLFPADDPGPARAMARSMSSCALHALAVLRALGVEHPALSVPYRTRLGRAVSDVVAIGSDLGALRQPGVGRWLYPGDVVLIGRQDAPRAWCRGTVAGEHVLVVTAADEDLVHSVDGGQGPGGTAIERRSRRLVRVGDEMWLSTLSSMLSPDGRPTVGRRVALWLDAGVVPTPSDALVPEIATR